MRKYLLLADLFNYPTENLIDKVTTCENEMESKNPETEIVLKEFKEHLESKKIGELQEYYSKTFDVNASCCMDIGYVIFGEDYKRGEFLVNMQNEQRNADHRFETELADYLPNVLKLFHYHNNREFIDELAYCITIPALKEILDKFRSPENIYRRLLVELLGIMEEDFGRLTREQINIVTEEDNKVFNRACNV